MGAPDGHAKNFSIFLTPGGRYRMTPVYDVMSVEPNHAANELGRKDFRMAMAVGDNRHYVMDEILPRHFRQTAKAAGVPQGDLDEIFADLTADFDAAFERALESLPAGFADRLVEPIRQRARRKLETIERA